MTTKIQLDPDALEAVAKVFAGRDNPGTLYLAPYYQEMADTAVTAYIAAIEPRLRELVDALIADANTLGIRRQRGDAAYLIQAASNQRSDTRAALFALFGLEPNE